MLVRHVNNAACFLVTFFDFFCGSQQPSLRPLKAASTEKRRRLDLAEAAGDTGKEVNFCALFCYSIIV